MRSHSDKDSWDDDLPDIPTTTAEPLTLAELQQRKLSALEEELRHMQHAASPQAALSSSSSSLGSTADEHAPTPTAVPTDGHAPLNYHTERLLCELRAAVPHLSPQFSCTYQDVNLLLAAIRNGGAGGNPGQLSVSEKLQSAEAANRGLQQRYQRQQDNEQLLRSELAAARQSAQVAQEQARRRTTVLSQRTEESRKQLLMEEGRSQRLQVKVKQLEAEVESLRDKLRASAR